MYSQSTKHSIGEYFIIIFSLKTRLCILKCSTGCPDCLQRCQWTRTPRPALIARQVALFATMQGQLGNPQVSREAASIISWYRSCQLYLPLSISLWLVRMFQSWNKERESSVSSYIICVTQKQAKTSLSAEANTCFDSIW